AYLHHSPDLRSKQSGCWLRLKSPSSRGPGHDPFTVVTGVRNPLGTPNKKPTMSQAWWVFYLASPGNFENPLGFDKRHATHERAGRRRRPEGVSAQSARIKPPGKERAALPEKRDFLAT